MSVSILRTKLFIPTALPTLLPRPRLYQRLEAGLQSGRRLSLISAPAGSGKTTLLSGWIAQSRAQITWLSLDPDDNDPARFWAYLVAALQMVAPQVGQALVPPTQATSVTALLNDLSALPQPVVLILDDYHTISNPAIHKDITLLLEHQPPALHLIFATRVDPALPIARLRARGQLTELRAADLRFTPAEAAAFLNEKMGLNLTAPDMAALENRTEGWIVGLQLAALSLQSCAQPHDFVAAFTGSHHFVLEYLTEEILGRLPEALRDFLLQTSILDRLCGPLCQAVTGRSESEALLAQLKQSNLFTVALDDEQRWYRYHHLFADLLRHRLKQTLAIEQIGDLHRRASAWLEAEGAIGEAVHHAFEAQDLERVACLAEQAVQSSLLDSRLTTLLAWVKRLPATVVRAHPRLCIYQAWALFINGQFEPALHLVSETRRGLEGLAPSPENDRMRAELAALLGVVETLSAGFRSLFDGDLAQAVQFHYTARARALALGNLALAAVATEGLALAQYHQGQLRQTARLCQAVIDLGEQGQAAPLPLAAAGYIELAGVYLEWNDLEAVERCWQKGLELCQQGGDAPNLAEAYLVQSQLCQARGDRAGAFAALQQAEQSLPAGSYSVPNFNVAIRRIRLTLSAGQAAEAARLLHALGGAAGFGLARHALPSSLHEVYQVLLARVCLAQHKPEEALALLEKAGAAAHAAHRLGRLIEIGLLTALAWQALGKLETALAALEQSLALAEPEGYLRLYLDEGAPLAALLQLARARGTATAYLRRLLAELAPQPAAASPAPAAGRGEPLSPAELKVLRLIAAGCSNREISERLVIALNTVKRHTHQIYSKLDVQSRTQALLRARQLGLIAPPPPD